MSIFFPISRATRCKNEASPCEPMWILAFSLRNLAHFGFMSIPWYSSPARWKYSCHIGIAPPVFTPISSNTTFSLRRVWNTLWYTSKYWLHFQTGGDRPLTLYFSAQSRSKFSRSSKEGGCSKVLRGSTRYAVIWDRRVIFARKRTGTPKHKQHTRACKLAVETERVINVLQPSPVTKTNTNNAISAQISFMNREICVCAIETSYSVTLLRRQRERTQRCVFIWLTIFCMWRQNPLYSFGGGERFG